MKNENSGNLRSSTSAAFPGELSTVSNAFSKYSAPVPSIEQYITLCWSETKRRVSFLNLPDLSAASKSQGSFALMRPCLKHCLLKFPERNFARRSMVCWEASCLWLISSRSKSSVFVFLSKATGKKSCKELVSFFVWWNTWGSCLATVLGMNFNGFRKTWLFFQTNFYKKWSYSWFFFLAHLLLQRIERDKNISFIFPNNFLVCFDGTSILQEDR